MPRSLLIILFALAGCELEELPSTAGEHVVYHWDADEHQLCGGTVPAVDRHLEVMAIHYGWPLEGRSVEYFWDADLAARACSRGDTLGCARRLSTSTLVFSDSPVDTHELAHTRRIRSGPALRGHLSFIEEGFATRWSSAILGLSNVPMSWENFLSEAELRAVLEANNFEFSYGYAFTWWLALEVGYGSAKMAEFMAAVEGTTSTEDVEAALRQVFDLSLAESVALAEDLPVGAIDDPACLIEDLPTITWAGDALAVEVGDPSCDDQDIINVFGDDAMWMFALEFPAALTPVEVHVTVPNGESLVRKSLHLVQCSGDFHVGELPPMLTAGAAHVGMPTGLWNLRGRYVGALHGPLASDGLVAFPRVVFRQAPP